TPGATPHTADTHPPTTSFYGLLALLRHRPPHRQTPGHLPRMEECRQPARPTQLWLRSSSHSAATTGTQQTTDSTGPTKPKEPHESGRPPHTLLAASRGSRRHTSSPTLGTRAQAEQTPRMRSR